MTPKKARLTWREKTIACSKYRKVSRWKAKANSQAQMILAKRIRKKRSPPQVHHRLAITKSSHPTHLASLPKSITSCKKMTIKSKNSLSHRMKRLMSTFSKSNRGSTSRMMMTRTVMITLRTRTTTPTTKTKNRQKMMKISKKMVGKTRKTSCSSMSMI